MYIVAVIVAALIGAFALPPAHAGMWARHFTQFAGQVTTVPGAFPGASAATYDPGHQVFYAFAGGQIYSVTLAAKATKLCPFGSAGVGGLVYDSTNQLIYATDTQGFAVYSISLGCTTTLLAGGSRGTNDGQGAAAQFQDPTGIALDAAKQVLLIADVDRIRAVTVGGAVTTFTAPGAIGQLGHQYFGPVTVGLSYDPAGGLLYVADSTRNMIESINGHGHVTVIAGHCLSLLHTTCDPLQVDGPLRRAGFAAPSGVAFDPADKALYVVDSANNEVRRIALRSVAMLAGSGLVGNANGTGILATFSNPQALSIDPTSGTMLVADFGNGKLRFVTTQGSPPPPPPHGTITYDPPTYLSYPNSIGVTPDGSVWFAEHDVGRIGRLSTAGQFREFSLPPTRGYPRNLIVGPDGAAWFSDTSLLFGGKGAVARISSSGAITEYPVSSFAQEVDSLAVGPDGNVWFTDYNGGVYGYVTVAGQVHEFTPPYGSVVSGYDGNMWLTSAISTNQNPATVYRYSTVDQLLNSYTLPPGYMNSFAAGANQAIWYMSSDNITQIGQLTADGNVSLMAVPSDPGCFSFGNSLTPGPAGKEWYVWSEYCNGFAPPRLASVTAAGKTTLFRIFAARTAPAAIAFAPDGTVWFADPGSDKIGRLY